MLLAVYFNPTATDRLLKGNAREALNKKVGRTGYGYVLGPDPRNSQWNVIDLPAGAGKLELSYADAARLRRRRRGPFACGTMWSNLRNAVKRGSRRCVYITSERMIKIPGPHRAGPFLDGRSDSFWRSARFLPLRSQHAAQIRDCLVVDRTFIDNNTCNWFNS